MARVFIGLGSNLGDRENNLRTAVEQLRKLPHTQVLKVSRWRETAPVGGPPQGNFLNGAAELETSLPPHDLLDCLLGIEAAMGRKRAGEKWGPRPIDLDLLAYDDLILDEPGLTLPHPRLHERRFVLEPLAEIASEWRHPRLRLTPSEMLRSLPTHADPPKSR